MKLLLTRVTTQSYIPNKRGFHVFSEEGFKINNGSYTGLLYCSQNKVPDIFIEIDVTDQLYEMLTRKENSWHKKYTDWGSKNRTLGFTILKQIILNKYGSEKYRRKTETN